VQRILGRRIRQGQDQRGVIAGGSEFGGHGSIFGWSKRVAVTATDELYAARVCVRTFTGFLPVAAGAIHQLTDCTGISENSLIFRQIPVFERSCGLHAPGSEHLWRLCPH
jgi:hypothetical protein